jgi:hypothetical protein
MSNWNHAQCEACWITAETTFDDDGNALIRRPHRLVGPNVEVCCYCGGLTIVGIYRREDPTLTRHCRHEGVAP